MLVLTLGLFPQLAQRCQLNRGGNNDGGDGGDKSDPHDTSGIGCHCSNTNMVANKSSTAAGNSRTDNNCNALDKRNSRLGTQN